MRRAARVSALLMTACLLPACRKSEEHPLTPWFRVVTNRRTEIAPHALALGENSEVGLMLQEGRWHEVVKGYERLQVYPVGDGLLTYGYDAVHVLREGRAPLQLPKAECPNIEPRPDVPEVVCTGCGTQPPLISLSETLNTRAPCPVVTATGRSLSGEVLWTRPAAWPALPDECVGGRSFAGAFTPEGDPLYVAVCEFRTPEGGWKQHQREFVLTERGLQERPSGGPRIEVRRLWPAE